MKRATFIMVITAGVFTTSHLPIIAQVPKIAAKTQKAVLLTEHRPLIIDLQTEIDGLPYRAHWNQYLDDLFHFLDTNNDKVLNDKEWACAPHPEQLLRQFKGREMEPQPAPNFPEFFGKSGMKSLSEKQFKAYYQQMDVGPIFVEYGVSGVFGGMVGNRLFEIMDKNNDKKLSESELKAAAKLLRQRDTDDDELISITEIMGTPSSQSIGFQVTSRPNAKTHAILMLDTEISVTKYLVGQLFEHYDHNKDKRFTIKELGVEPKTFAKLDTDKDSHWSEKELRSWLKGPADLRVQILFGKSVPAGKRLAVAAAKPASFQPKKMRGGSYVIPGANDQLEIMAQDSRSANVKKKTQSLTGKFQQFDDGDNVLDTKEIYRPPFAWMGVFRLADRNLDDRLTLKEVQAFEKLVEKASAVLTRVLIVDREPSLFEILDVNHDGSLSLRELRDTPERLKKCDKENDKYITLAELPGQIHMVVGHGMFSETNRSSSSLGYGPAHKSYQAEEGPLWFRKMDNNKDGDLSPREFLGSRKVFQTIDRDHDGLIDVEEAEKASIETKSMS